MNHQRLRSSLDKGVHISRNVSAVVTFHRRVKGGKKGDAHFHSLLQKLTHFALPHFYNIERQLSLYSQGNLIKIKVLLSWKHLSICMYLYITTNAYVYTYKVTKSLPSYVCIYILIYYLLLYTHPIYVYIFFYI
jgi:hypothetical protein